MRIDPEARESGVGLNLATDRAATGKTRCAGRTCDGQGSCRRPDKTSYRRGSKA